MSATAMPTWFSPLSTGLLSADGRLQSAGDEAEAEHGGGDRGQRRQPARDRELEDEGLPLLDHPQRAAGDDPAALEADDHGRRPNPWLRLPGQLVAAADGGEVEGRDRVVGQL